MLRDGRTLVDGVTGMEPRAGLALAFLFLPDAAPRPPACDGPVVCNIGSSVTPGAWAGFWLAISMLHLRCDKKAAHLCAASGEFPHSKVHAVMGASGCGKSCFLQALCGRVTRGDHRRHGPVVLPRSLL